MPPRAKLNVKPKTARSTIRASPDAAGAAPTPKATSTTPTSTTLKTIDLKTLLALFGSPTSGTKPTLISRLRHDVATPKLTPAVRRASGPAVQRIVSVDMGIRNLAFCVADVEIREASRQQSKSKSKDITPAGPEVSLSVVAWERIAVQELTAAEENDGAGEEGEGEGAAPEKESFLPSALSHIAYTLLTRALLPHAPGTLLIEQQRYRSQGSSAVQEWTYRVNMLEGMLWAVIKTLKAEEDKKAQARLASSSSSDGKSTSTADASSSVPLPSPHAVSPQRVANFWMTATPLGRALMAAKQPRRQSGRLKVEKRDKIAFLSAWLARSSGSDAVAIPSIVDAIMDEEGGASGSPLDNEVSVSFKTPVAAATRNAFLEKMVGKERGRRKKKKKIMDVVTNDELNDDIDADKVESTSIENDSLASTAATGAVTGDDGSAQGQYQGTSTPISQEEAAAGTVEAQQRHLGSTGTEAVRNGQQTGHGNASGRERGSSGRKARAAGAKIGQGQVDQDQGKQQGQGQGLQEHGRLEHDGDLAHDLAQTQPSAQAIMADSLDSAATTTTSSSSSTAASITEERDIGKLDDLADCLLQAAAWARWEGNRRTIEELMLKHDDGDEDALKRFAVACARGADEV